MERFFLKLAYNGKNYHGWQMQPKDISVQEILEKALSTILRSPIEIVGAGRTDSGVHAREMFAHFDAENLPETSELIKKLNSFLPTDIAVSDVISVHHDAHARFDAVSRTYQYHIHQNKNPFLHDSSWFYPHNLDLEKMNQAANILLEYVDFECFSKTNTDVNTFNCKITHARWQKTNDEIIFSITADRFLRNMVRAVVGTLIEVGIGKLEPENIRNIILSKNRSNAGFSVPAHGLYLTQIVYPYL